MTKVKVRNSPEAKRWLIVGAHQAGASEKHVARISGLSKTAVRNIILNYQRTGTPCIPKRIPNKIREKLIVEYDENGNIIDTDDEEEEEVEEEQEVEPEISTSSSVFKLKSSPFQMKRRIVMKKKHLFKKPVRKPKSSGAVTTKDIIHYAMDQMRITNNPTSMMQTPLYLSPPKQPEQQTKRLPPPTKYDQEVRGYELWTHDDDMILLNHVLHHLYGGGWNELEIRFEGRHSARLCYDRWRYLKSLLLKGITDKPNTPW